MTAMVVVACCGMLLMELNAWLPYAVGPGMGLDAFFAYTIVVQQSVHWQTALGVVFWAGAMFLVPSATRVREYGRSPSGSVWPPRVNGGRWSRETPYCRSMGRAVLICTGESMGTRSTDPHGISTSFPPVAAMVPPAPMRMPARALRKPPRMPPMMAPTPVGCGYPILVARNAKYVAGRRTVTLSIIWP